MDGPEVNQTPLLFSTNDRILLTLLRCALGVLLLSDVSFESTYQTVHQFPVLQAGLSDLNTTLIQLPELNLNSTATSLFWWYYPSLLADGKLSRPVSPLSCSGEACTSFFLPGALSTVVFEPDMPNITEVDYPTATTFIQNDAPGYQIDFYPVDENDPPLTLNDCRIFGITTNAIQICLKMTDASFLAGTSIKLI